MAETRSRHSPATVPSPAGGGMIRGPPDPSPLSQSSQLNPLCCPLAGMVPQSMENAPAKPGFSDFSVRGETEGRQPRGQPSDPTYLQTSGGELPQSGRRNSAALDGRAPVPQGSGHRGQEDVNIGSAQAGSSACKFYMKTGTCDYGDHCRFEHPTLKKPALKYNSQQLPLRPGEPECSFYMKNYRCGFGSSCKFNHAELVAVYAPSSGSVMPPGMPFIAPGIISPMGGPVGVPMTPAYAASGSGTAYGQLGNVNSPYVGQPRPPGAGLLAPVVTTPVEAPIDRLSRMLGAPRGQSGGRGTLVQTGSTTSGRSRSGSGLTAPSDEAAGRGAKLIRRARDSVLPARYSPGGDVAKTGATQNLHEYSSAAGSAAPTPAAAAEGAGKNEGPTGTVNSAVDDVAATFAGTSI